SGDYLGRIAERSGVRAARIQELNPNVRFEPLQIGVKLRLPYSPVEKLAVQATPSPAPAPETRVAAAPAEAAKQSAPPATVAAGTRTPEVRAGETVWQIATDNHLSVAALQKANDLNGSTIRPGMELKRPASAEAVPQTRTAEHVVRGGDTL